MIVIPLSISAIIETHFYSLFRVINLALCTTTFTPQWHRFACRITMGQLVVLQKGYFASHVSLLVNPGFGQILRVVVVVYSSSDNLHERRRVLRRHGGYVGANPIF